jgi:hypothetical protein
MKNLNEIFDMCPSFYERESFANGYLKGYEQAEEETIKEVCELLKNNIDEYVLPNKGLDLDWLIEDLKKNLEDKV